MAAPQPGSARRSRVRDATVIEEEVRRLVARELHDRVAQTLTGMLVDVENFKAEEVGWTDVVQQLDRVQSSTRQVLQNIRHLLHDLRGEETTERGFEEGLTTLTRSFSAATQIEVDVFVSPRWPAVLTRQAHLNLYRIVEEALANVRMHSGAGRVEIRLEPYSDSEVSMVIVDDGRGVDVTGSRPMGLGTIGMKERAVVLGGHLSITSGAHNGTTIRAIFGKASLIPKGQLPSTEVFIGSEVLV